MRATPRQRGSISASNREENHESTEICPYLAYPPNLWKPPLLSRKIPTDELLNEIRQLARELNRTPTKKQMNNLGEYYSRTYLNRFGSWNEAVRQAGFKPNRRIPEAEFIDRPDACPLCGESPADGLDFHHWRYGENKTGCYLCRECHDHVHTGGARPDENSRWLMQAVENLI